MSEFLEFCTWNSAVYSFFTSSFAIYLSIFIISFLHHRTPNPLCIIALLKLSILNAAQHWSAISGLLGLMVNSWQAWGFHIPKTKDILSKIYGFCLHKCKSNKGHAWNRLRKNVWKLMWASKIHFAD